MAEFQESVSPRELICELTLDGQLAGRYRILENVDVTRDGVPFTNSNRSRELTSEEGAAIIGGDSAAALAQFQAAQQQIAELQETLKAATERMAKLEEALAIYRSAEDAWKAQVQDRVQTLVAG